MDLALQLLIQDQVAGLLGYLSAQLQVFLVILFEPSLSIVQDELS